MGTMCRMKQHRSSHARCGTQECPLGRLTWCQEAKEVDSIHGSYAVGGVIMITEKA